MLALYADTPVQPVFRENNIPMISVVICIRKASLL